MQNRMPSKETFFLQIPECPVARLCSWSAELEIVGRPTSEEGSLTRSLGVTVNMQVWGNNSLPALLVIEEI